MVPDVSNGSDGMPSLRRTDCTGECDFGLLRIEAANHVDGWLRRRLPLTNRWFECGEFLDVALPF